MSECSRHGELEQGRDDVNDALPEPLTAAERRMQASTDGLMDRRAQRLAKTTGCDADSDSSLTAVGFRLGGQNYAIDERHLTEVIRRTDITTVPGTPEFVRGLTLYRGSALAVFDLAILLGLPSSSSAGDDGYLLVFGDSAPEFAVSVGEIYRAVVLDRDSISGHADRIETTGGYTLGVASDGLIILDGDRLLHDEALHIGVAASE